MLCLLNNSLRFVSSSDDSDKLNKKKEWREREKERD